MLYVLASQLILKLITPLKNIGRVNKKLCLNCYLRKTTHSPDSNPLLLICVVSYLLFFLHYFCLYSQEENGEALARQHELMKKRNKSRLEPEHYNRMHGMVGTIREVHDQYSSVTSYGMHQTLFM